MWWKNLLGWLLALCALLGIGTAVPLSYHYCGGSKDEVFKLLPGSLTAAVAVAGIVAGLFQFVRNSHDRRVERSMAFWRRSNTDEFTQYLTLYLERLVQLDQKADLPEFERVARRPGESEESKKLRKAIEYLLDFYDEACSAVVTGACDEYAMHYYLGGIVIRERDALAGFIQVFLKETGRPEKWVAFLRVAESWARGRYVNSPRKIRAWSH